MYEAKSHGKNESMLFTPLMKSVRLEQMQLSNDLHRALEYGELMLYYQPQISIATNKIIGVEALIRWRHPELGFIAPSKFIPIAEHSGLIIPIGEWVLRTACRQNKLWQQSGLSSVRMAVNLSMNQFQTSKVADMVKRILKETGLNGEFLELEITESIAMNETAHVAEILQSFRDMGVTISIDDFGTDYSSLQYLKHIPIDRIKIAMPFVSGISVNEKDEAIIKTIIVLSKSLGFAVIAEGVETKEQLDFLSEHLCDEVQGYYYYEPMTADNFEKLLRGENVHKIA
jgi:EAL domain-containing protein (putative c-di-GMP-specific phosphodiesterase class I)